MNCFLNATNDIINNMNYVIYVYELVTNVPVKNRKTYSENNDKYFQNTEVSLETLYNEYKKACMYLKYITESSLRRSLKSVYAAIAYVNQNHPFFKVDMKMPTAMITFCNQIEKEAEVIVNNGEEFFVPIIAIEKKEKNVPAKHHAIGYLGESVLKENVSVG